MYTQALTFVQLFMANQAYVMGGGQGNDLKPVSQDCTIRNSRSTNQLGAATFADFSAEVKRLFEPCVNVLRAQAQGRCCGSRCQNPTGPYPGKGG